MHNDRTITKQGKRINYLRTIFMVNNNDYMDNSEQQILKLYSLVNFKNQREKNDKTNYD